LGRVFLNVHTLKIHQNFDPIDPTDPGTGFTKNPKPETTATSKPSGSWNLTLRDLPSLSNILLLLLGILPELLFLGLLPRKKWSSCMAVAKKHGKALRNTSDRPIIGVSVYHMIPAEAEWLIDDQISQRYLDKDCRILNLDRTAWDYFWTGNLTCCVSTTLHFETLPLLWGWFIGCCTVSMFAGWSLFQQAAWTHWIKTFKHQISNKQFHSEAGILEIIEFLVLSTVKTRPLGCLPICKTHSIFGKIAKKESLSKHKRSLGNILDGIRRFHDFEWLQDSMFLLRRAAH